MPNLKDLNDQLITASLQGDSDKVTVLISQIGPTLNGSVPLRAAAREGNAECVKLLIPFSDPNADNHPLQAAALNDHVECVQLLIPFSDPKAYDSLALSWAAATGHADCLKLLIPVSDPKANHSLALLRAAINGHADCVALLLPVSDPLALDENGLTPSDRARTAGHSDIAGMIDAFIEAQALSNSLLARHANPAHRPTL